MKFAIAMTDIEGEWDALPADRQERILEQHKEFQQALKDAGRWVGVFHFYPRNESRTVRMSANGDTTVQEGPFSQAKEYIGGFYVITADSMDEAVEWARRGRFMTGANEVRQIWE